VIRILVAAPHNYMNTYSTRRTGKLTWLCVEARASLCLLSGIHVEYAERGKEYGILFMLSLFCEYGNLEYVHFHVIYRVNQAEYCIRIRVAASQEYVNIYSTCRLSGSVGRWRYTVPRSLIQLAQEFPITKSTKRRVNTRSAT